MIEGKKREKQKFAENKKFVGLFEAKVVAVNPTAEEFKEILDIELKEDSKATEYLGEKDDNTTLRVDVWLEEVKTKNKFKVNFYLEDRIRENKDRSKKQYINNIGSISWAADENDLPTWFAKRDYRVAFVGEEELYHFLRTWLNLDYSDNDTVLQVEWKSLMRGNVKTIKEQINGSFCNNVLALATIKTSVKDGETKEYQNVYNKAFLEPYAIKNFRLVNYDDAAVINVLREKKSKELKTHERFVLNVKGEYGCKDFHVLKDFKEYNSNENLVSTDAVISNDDSSY